MTIEIWLNGPRAKLAIDLTVCELNEVSGSWTSSTLVFDLEQLPAGLS
jgi:hypothetical protein